MSVFFLGSWGMNREKTLIPYIYNVSTRTFYKILQKKLLIQNSHSNGHLTSFDVLIAAHVIRPNRRTFCWLCSSGIKLKYLVGFNEENMIPV